MKRKKEDPIVDRLEKVETCSSCGWTHEGDEDQGGIAVRANIYGKRYFVCHLSQEKVFITEEEEVNG